MPTGVMLDGDEAIYEYLKEHDPQGLSDILQARIRHVRQQQQQQEHELRNNASHEVDSLPGSILQEAWISQLVGPFDLTAPQLPPHRIVSEHVHFIRNHDWASTPLGPMSSWSLELRRMVNFALADSRAACLWWGHQRIGIYNEHYKVICAHRHPTALGSSVSQVWPELVDSEFGHAYDRADQTGLPSNGPGGVFFVERAGYIEELWASWDVIPVPGPNGNLGCYNVCIEQTQEVLSERRMMTLHNLGLATAEANEIRDYWQQVLQGLERHHDEVPFAAIYSSTGHFAPSRSSQPELKRSVSDGSTDDNTSVSSTAFSGTEWTLEGTLAFNTADNTLPSTVDLDTGPELLTPLFTTAMNSKDATLLSFNQQIQALRDMAKSRKYDGEQCRTVVFLPIRSNCEEHRSGFLLLGLNTRRIYDADYARFIATLHMQLINSYTAVVIEEIEARRARIASKTAAKDRVRLVKQLVASQQETEESNLRFRGMADLAPIGIFTFDAQGTLLYANQYWYELLGYSATSPGKGMALNEALHEGDRRAFATQWESLLAGKEIHFECRLSRPYHTDEIYAGERLEGESWVLIAAYAIGDGAAGSGVVDEIFGCLVDISRQKWMEGFQSRRLKEQQERTRQQENFMDSTSHEARNPLAAITLCADDLHTTLKSLPDGMSADPESSDHLLVDRKTHAALLDSVEIIIACAKHQKRIIDDVLTLSKLDSGMLITSATPVQPTAVIAQALRMFQAELKRSDVELMYTVSDSYRDHGVDWVMLDSTRFLQILINLLNNAIKFTKPELSRKITITIQASMTRPRPEDHGVQFAPSAEPRTPTANQVEPPGFPTDHIYLYVAIEDTGPGLIESEIENLFQRFQQASPKTYAQYGGSGLGLWISKELCAKLGGQIGVASSGGSGTSGSRGSTFAFYVHVPMCLPPAAESQHTVPPNNHPIIIASLLDGMMTPPPYEQDESVFVNLASPSVPVASLSDLDPFNAVSAAPPKKAPAETTVLVVEDNLINQRVMSRQLSREGFRVLVANHGKEALEVLFSSSTGSETDIILMDIEMPVMDGLECTTRIRERERAGSEKRLPILGVTANVRAEQQAAAMKAGMDTVVTKPFHMVDLLAAIAERVGTGAGA